MKNGGLAASVLFDLPPPFRRSRRRWWRGLGIGRAAARAEEHPGRVAVEIVHGPADVGERLAAVRHQRARALVKIFGELVDRFHGLEQLPTILAAGERVEAE